MRTAASRASSFRGAGRHPSGQENCDQHAEDGSAGDLVSPDECAEQQSAGQRGAEWCRTPVPGKRAGHGDHVVEHTFVGVTDGLGLCRMLS